MNCHLILPAAGIGRRFGGEVPKQYTRVAGKTVMDWTLSAFQTLNFINHTVLVLASGDTIGQAIARKYPTVTTVAGGEERYESVMNGLRWLSERVPGSDWVMVHDIARPCVSAAEVTRLYEYCCRRQVGGVLSTPMTDTVKRQVSATEVETLDRSVLWTVQTPQCFRLEELKTALHQAHTQNIPVTDEASAIELSGGQVSLLEGSRRNIKLTNPDDLAIVEFFLTTEENKP